ncbi:MAG TPA: NUDIX hydrolase, partial [Aurantimonas sp.]|nr:NUDIX hydrolase [Aurantimonas sp.]
MTKIKRRKQFAALPFRTDADGVEVLLVTSRDTGRWVIPKGWPMKNRRPHRAAAIEAFEEAGVVGKASKVPMGTYDYDK